MDKSLIRERFVKAMESYSRNADVQHRIAERMVNLIHRYVPSYTRRNVLEVGCGTGGFTRLFLEKTTDWSNLYLNDLCPEFGSCLSDILDERIRFLPGDAEKLDFPGGQDLIVSCSVIQWFDSPERFLVGCRDLLKEGGYLAFSTFGPENLREIALLLDISLPYRPLSSLTETLGGYYQMIYCSEEIVQLSFVSPMGVLKHLKETGVTGVRQRSWTKGVLNDFCSNYMQSFPYGNDNVSLTYHPIYVVCKKIDNEL